MKTIIFEASSANIFPNATNLSIEVELRDIELFNLLDEIGERSRQLSGRKRIHNKRVKKRKI